MAGSLERELVMAVRRLLLAAVLVTLPGSATSGPLQDPAPPKFRSSVEVVSITAVVRDRKGRFVRDLRQEDFVILEAGDPRRILDFRAETDGPLKLGLLVDASGSMRVGGKTVDAIEVARMLFSSLRQTDEAALFSFDTRLDLVSRFTSDLDSLEQALHRLNPPFGQTSLYDAIADASVFVAEQARDSKGLPQRTALVVLTDGIDTTSRRTTEQVAAIASRIEVPVYVVVVLSPMDDPQEKRKAAFDVSGLRELALATGGEMFVASAPAQASVASRQIVSELRHQYVLAFEASAASGWRPIEVRARDGRLNVRARTGYEAGTHSRPAAGGASAMLFGEPAAFSAVACEAL